MTNFKPGDRVVCVDASGGIFNSLVEGQVYEVASTLEMSGQPAIELAKGKGAWLAHRFKKENNMTKINLSTGVEATLHGNGDVTLPGDYMTNTSFLEASGVTWEPAYTPGIYRDEDGDLWVLTPGGDWLQEIGNQGLQNSRGSIPPYKYYTLTPVKPESF